MFCFSFLYSAPSSDIYYRFALNKYFMTMIMMTMMMMMMMMMMTSHQALGFADVL